MRSFSKVAPAVWRSARFKSLISDDAKLFYLFCLTSEHQTSAGIFRLPDAYAAADLGWTSERIEAARALLIEAALIEHDDETYEYFVLRWFKHNPATNPKHVMGIERLISEIESDMLRDVVERDFDTSREKAVEDQKVTPIGNHLTGTK